MTHTEVEKEINSLISQYDFPLLVLQDIHQRLSDCREVGYAAQQLRYLQNIVNAGMAKERGITND